MRQQLDRDLIGRAGSVELVALAQKHGAKLRRRGKDWAGPCPHCAGNDRFVVTPHKGVFFCRGCNASGDAIELLRFLTGCNFQEAIEQLTGAPLPDRQEPAKTAHAPPSQRRQMSIEFLRWWDDASSIFGTSVEAYLTNPRDKGGRFIDIEQIPDIDDTLRYHPKCIFAPKLYQPCLLALIRHVVTDEMIGVVRISIDCWGRKAPIIEDGKPVARKTLGQKTDGAVKLWSHASAEHGLIIGEGIETTAAAATRIEHEGALLQPAWALIDSGNLKYFPVLPEIEHLTILVDNDPPDKHFHCAGQDAADTCTTTWTEAGRYVEQLISPVVGEDFNDIAFLIDEVS